MNMTWRNMLYPILGPRYYEQFYMYLRLGYWPNLLSPESFNEHIAHIKLNYKRHFSPTLADKYLVRAHVQNKVGEEYLVPLAGVIVDARDLPSLPTKGQYIAKAAHASGWNQVSDAGISESVRELKTSLQKWLRCDYGIPHTNEHWYSELSRRVVIEHLLVDNTYGYPMDFKFYVFSGKVMFIQVDSDRFGSHSRRYYSPEWTSLTWGAVYPLSIPVAAPSKLDEMIYVAEKLAESHQFVRVDLYCVNASEVYFGELTFAPESGRGKFFPSRQVDFALGAFFQGAKSLHEAFAWRDKWSEDTRS